MKLIILGIDGLAPQLIQAGWDKGQLPNLFKLKQLGSYAHLNTANPAQSPVVWTSIATGTNPGEHGLFDFISRDPQTYLPHLAIFQPNKRNILGLRSKLYMPVFYGNPFWQITSQAGIPSTVIKWPVTFPPTIIKGKMLAGLGVPDLRNTLGQYTLITSDPQVNQFEKKGQVIKIADVNISQVDLFGPNDSRLPIAWKTISAHDRLEVSLGGSQVKLDKGKWSDWLKVKFQDRIKRNYFGMVKMYLAEIKPHLYLYTTSIHYDPERPLAPISTPDNYAQELVDEIGLFHTLGMAEETNGLQDELLSRKAFLDFALSIQSEREKIFWHEFDRFSDGLLAFVFDTLDRVQHMFWYTQDQGHPINQVAQQDKFATVLERFYNQLDILIGKIVKAIPANTGLMIISDHGFSTFRWEINLNSWLVKNQLLRLKGDANIGAPLFANVDWSQTQAYAVGFSSLFINLKGREKHGIVSPDKAINLAQQIAAMLKIWQDKSGQQIFKNVYLKQDIYHGQKFAEAPELIVGANSGFRLSWQTALGAAPKQLLNVNLHQWSGDHIIDPRLVPGVFLSNWKINQPQPSVYDIAPTVLKFFSLKVPDYMKGSALL